MKPVDAEMQNFSTQPDEDINGKDHDQVMLMHDRMISDQDKHLDTILGVT